jgi:thiamine biosynthesis lipoprotein
MRRIAVPLTMTPETAQPREGRAVWLEGPTMGVSWRLRAHAPRDLSEAAIARAVQGACDLVVAQMSAWEPDSDLSRFNRAPAGAWVDAPEDLLRVVAAAVETAQLTGGAFDPTVGAVVDLWGFGPPGAIRRPPAADQLAATQVGWRGLRVDLEADRLYQPGGLRLDLSGIAKGYGVDLAARALRTLGLRDFLLEIGGELRGEGVKGDGEPWWVEIEPPPGAALAQLPVLVALHGLSIATSGDWRRSFQADGRTYSHTIDPRTRAPARTPFAAVSVLHADCMHADALCTALLVLGDEAQAFARAHEIAAVFVIREGEAGREILTPAFEALLG